MDKFTKIYLSLWGVCLVVGVLFFTLYKFGYRLDKNLSPVKVGSVIIESDQTGFQLFLNNRERAIKNDGDEYVISDITPGAHSIVVSKNGFWPWAKTFSVEENTVRKLFVFLLPIDGAKLLSIKTDKDLHLKISKNIEQQILPEQKFGSVSFSNDQLVTEWLSNNVVSPVFSKDRTTATYVSDGTIYVAWVSEVQPVPHYFCTTNPCKFVVPVTVSNFPIKSVGFYKNRSDVIIFSAGTSIYAIEVDQEGTQNFQPIYRGTDPYFYVNSEGVAYVKDGADVFQLVY